MPVPVIAAAIPAIAGLVGNVISSRQANKSVEKATNQQVQSADRALGIAKEAYGPYMNTGAQAMTTLGGMMGLPPMAAPSPGPGGPQASPAAAAPAERRTLGDAMADWRKTHPPQPSLFERMRQKQLAEAEERAGAEPSAGRSLFDRVRQSAAQEQSQSSYGATVPMVGPDGDQYDVPAEQEKMWTERGARRVS
jgi:hypothetical protein